MLYTGLLQSAAENFLIETFGSNGAMLDPEKAAILVDAAMHIVSRRPWGSMELVSAGAATNPMDDGDGTDIQSLPDEE